MEKLSLNDSATDSYQYSPLPSVRHIRLLQIQPRSTGPCPTPIYNDHDPVRISVNIACLDDDPRYDALSYTWGNPITVYQNEDEANQQRKLFEQPCHVLCDGKPIVVTRNLYEAFLAIRRVPSQGSYKTAHGSDRADHIWIDAICIHQQNIDERNSQVRIMDQIYAKAQMTIIWLGRDDIFTRTAGTAFSRIHELTPEKTHSMRAEPFVIESGGHKKSIFPQMSETDWIAVYAFLNRSWFMRVWTIQEVALAARSVVLCGMVMLSWSQLVRICIALDKSRIYDRIEVLVARYMKNNSQGQASQQGETASQPYLYQTQSPSHFYPPQAVVGIAHVRAGLGIKDKYLTYISNPEVLDLTGLMASFRSSFASEPRDRVYGFLGLAPTKVIVPDYGKSIQTVYLDAISYHLEQTQNLIFLGEVQDQSRKSLKNLPSWVPDYSAEMFPQRFSNISAAASQFCAADRLQFSYRLLMEPAPSLQLQGYILGAVEDVAEFDKDYDLGELIELLWDLPHLYTADIQHRADEITEGLSGKLELKIEGGYLQGVETQKENTSSGDSANEGEKELLPMSEPSKPWLANARLQTHVEVLWRTLIADTWEGQHPAPIKAGFAFANTVIAKMQLLFSKIHSSAVEAKKDHSKLASSPLPDEESGPHTTLDKLYQAYEIFAESEFEGFTRVQDIRAVAEDGTVNTLSSADPLVAKLPPEKVSKTLTQFLPVFDIFSDMLQHSADIGGITLWTRRFGQFMPGRKLFRTSPYPFLGSGPKSLDAGDSVCILAGGSVPYLLRKVADQGGNRYTFIGEAYVHGMMHGEANYIMALENQSLTDIILV